MLACTTTKLYRTGHVQHIWKTTTARVIPYWGVQGGQDETFHDTERLDSPDKYISAAEIEIRTYSKWVVSQAMETALNRLVHQDIVDDAYINNLISNI